MNDDDESQYVMSDEVRDRILNGPHRWTYVFAPRYDLYVWWRMHNRIDSGDATARLRYISGPNALRGTRNQPWIWVRAPRLGWDQYGMTLEQQREVLAQTRYYDMELIAEYYLP